MNRFGANLKIFSSNELETVTRRSTHIATRARPFRESDARA